MPLPRPVATSAPTPIGDGTGRDECAPPGGGEGIAAVFAPIAPPPDPKLSPPPDPKLPDPAPWQADPKQVAEAIADLKATIARLAADRRPATRSLRRLNEIQLAALEAGDHSSLAPEPPPRPRVPPPPSTYAGLAIKANADGTLKQKPAKVHPDPAVSLDEIRRLLVAASDSPQGPFDLAAQAAFGGKLAARWRDGKPETAEFFGAMAVKAPADFVWAKIVEAERIGTDPARLFAKSVGQLVRSNARASPSRR